MATDPLIRKTFRLSPAMFATLKELATQEGVSVAEAVRRVLQRGLGIVPAQLPALAAGSRKDRAALLLAQWIHVVYGEFRHANSRAHELNKSRETRATLKKLAAVAWICSEYLEKPGK